MEGEQDIGEFESKVFADQDLETKMGDPAKKRQNPWEENSPRGIFRVSWSPTRFSTPIIPDGKKVSSSKIAIERSRRTRL